MLKDHQKSKGELHQPVLAKEVLACLDPKPGESYLDLTAGYGGHASQIVAKTKAPEFLTLVDRDQAAITVLAKLFAGSTIIHSDYLSAAQDLASQNKQFDMVLADLGVSSVHLDDPERGFSFSTDGPLDMRMDQAQELSAAQIVNQASESELTRIIKDYGEEPKAHAIAKRIVANRPLNTTSELAQLIVKAYGPWARTVRHHPATKTFQALRMAVNDELSQLSGSLDPMQKLLAPGGRLAIISFHSLEDRLVKQYFAEHAGDRYDAELRPITKKPLTAGKTEISLNPRARSAKLRAACKIKTNRKGKGPWMPIKVQSTSRAYKVRVRVLD